MPVLDHLLPEGGLGDDDQGALERIQNDSLRFKEERITGKRRKGKKEKLS